MTRPRRHVHTAVRVVKVDHDNTSRGITGLRGIDSRFRRVVIGFAKRTACSPTRQPRIKTSSMECMTASQSAHVIIVLQRVYADSTGVARGAQALWRESSVDVLIIILILLLMGCPRLV
jgi:hypothetical protein